MGDGKKEKGKLLRVRDRRTQHQFSIHNRIIDEWYPIIQARGFALYSLYCRMASKDEERCYPGYRMIAKHMGMGQSTISDYNKLLVWCGLIHIEPGDPTENTPNDYYVLDIPSANEATLAAIRAAVEEEMARLATEREARAKRLAQNGLTEEAAKVRRQKPGSFYTSLLKRLDRWQPIQAYWHKRKKRPSVVRPAQLALFDAPDGEQATTGGEGAAPGGEQAISDGEQPVPGSGAEQAKATSHNNKPKQQATTTGTTAASENGDRAAVAAVDIEPVTTEILDWMGFNGSLNEAERAAVTADLLLAWAYWVRLEGSTLAAQGKNPVGIARASWRRGERPGGGLAALAQIWLALAENGRRLLLEDAEMAAYRFDNEMVAAAELGLDGNEAAAFYRLWQATNGVVGPPALLPQAEQMRREPEAAAEADEEKDEAAGVWRALRAALVEQLSPEAVDSLLAGSSLKLTETRAVIEVGNVYSAAWINDRLVPVFERTLSEIVERPLTVTAVVKREVVNG